MAVLSDILSVEEIDQINDIRRILLRVQETCMKVNNFELDGIDNYHLGRFVQTVDDAENLLFQVLNSGNSYIDLKVDDAQLFIRRKG